jgi:excisionase family DNA binding protein
VAKLFYTLEEASQVLGMPQDQVRQMASSGKLQQFRDRDKLMYKREQVDALKAQSSAKSATGSGAPIPLAGPSDNVDLKKDQARTPPGRKEDPRQATGVSVFDADEIEPADPLAQTQVTQSVADEEELALESVGSGSGLLDLTRESDDTSLGAELLDEIYPGSPEGGEAKPGVSATGIAGIAAESGASGLENLQAAGLSAEAGMIAVEAVEPPDPGGSGLGLGFLLGAFIALILVMIVTVAGMTNTANALTTSMAQSGSSLALYCVGLLVISAIMGAVGFFIGKAVG